jgi:hypothetical protein
MKMVQRIQRILTDESTEKNTNKESIKPGTILFILAVCARGFFANTLRMTRNVTLKRNPVLFRME